MRRRPVYIDFRARSLLARHGMLLTFVAGLLVVGVFLVPFNSARVARNESLQMLEASRIAAGSSAPASTNSVSEYGAAADEALAQDWLSLFAALEAADADEIAVLGVTADSSSGQVSVSGQAKNADAIVKYARQLSEEKRLSQVLIKSYSQMPDQPYDPLGFEVVARWSGTAVPNSP